MAQTLRLSDTAKDELAHLKEKLKEKTDNSTIERVILNYAKVQKELEEQLKRANKFEQMFYNLRDVIKQRVNLAKKLKELLN